MNNVTVSIHYTCHLCENRQTSFDPHAPVMPPEGWIMVGPHLVCDHHPHLIVLNGDVRAIAAKDLETAETIFTGGKG